MGWSSFPYLQTVHGTRLGQRTNTVCKPGQRMRQLPPMGCILPPCVMTSARTHMPVPQKVISLSGANLVGQRHQEFAELSDRDAQQTLSCPPIREAGCPTTFCFTMCLRLRRLLSLTICVHVALLPEMSGVIVVALIFRIWMTRAPLHLPNKRNHH